MELVWNQHGNELEKLARAATPKCTCVLAAIAYATDKTLLDICWRSGKPLCLYARYDYSGPVNDVVSQWFLSKGTQNADYQLLLVPDIFHPKVIWWRGVGAYIGSANLTSTAWTRNIEAGVFLSEQELVDSGMSDQLDSLFDQVSARATPIRPELATEMANARASVGKAQHPAERQFEATRLLPPVPSIISVTKVSGADRRRNDFLKEWNQTLQYLRDLGSRLVQPRNLPRWLPHAPPAGVIADQFLHAVYYNRVKDGQAHPYDEWYKRNRESKEQALAVELAWWSQQNAAPGSEDDHILRWAPLVCSLLGRDKILNLSQEQFVQLCTHIHAMRDHARRLNHETFGVQHGLSSMASEERVEHFGRWLYVQRSAGGHSTLELFHRVLYGGPRDDAPNRLFDCWSDPAWKIPHVGVSTLGEMIGWAMPDYFPPRNGRTSKALRALGYDVKIHSE